MANDKLSKENLPLLHQQTPRHNLKATADCVALPPCCKNAPVGYYKSETLRVIRESYGVIRSHTTLYVKGVEMLVVSLRRVNFGFRSRSGCSGHYLAVKVSFRVAHEKI